jgi:hypothetical protein
MNFYPGEIVKVKKIKEWLSPARMKTFYRYLTPKGQFVSSRKVRSQKVVILKVKKEQRKSKPFCWVDTFPLSQDDLECSLENLNKGLNEQTDKRFYESKLKNLLSDGKILTKIEKQKDKKYLVRVEDVLFLLYASKNLNYLEGKEKLFPVSAPLFGKRKKGEITRMGVYKTDEDFPRIYKARIEINKPKINKEAIIYLHGFVEPEKWHFVTLTHFKCALLGRKSLLDVSSLPTLCQEIKKKKEADPKSIHNCDVERCLKEGAFPKAHPKMAFCCQQLQRRAVTFWEKAKTKFFSGTFMRKGFSNNVVKFQIVVTEKNENTYNNLICRAITYN